MELKRIFQQLHHKHETLNTDFLFPQKNHFYNFIDNKNIVDQTVNSCADKKLMDDDKLKDQFCS